MASTTSRPPHIPKDLDLPEGLSEEKLLAFSPFNNWLKQLTHSLTLQHTNPKHPFHNDPYKLHAVQIQSFDLFGRPPNQRLGFLKLTASIRNAAGETLPGSVFLRGPSVAMLVVLVDVDTEERHVVLTVQPRIPAGSLAFVELPAGMLDEGGSFAGQAAQEMQEELGLEIPAEELRCLSDLAVADGLSAKENREGEEGDGEEEEEGLSAAMFPSAGGCDEFIKIFLFERRVPASALREWTGKLTGLRDEGEKITLKLVRLEDLWREGARDAKCLAALALWEGLRRENKL
ncbi:hypothetical protein M426DRAFT_20120 [Hypoxylon sp. CI-4A]|nr:hypothetical protein M426DRAFT_20120 [Hypoxylon sp. CI-4A]